MMVIDQHAALRHRHEKAELDKNQQDRDENAAGGERGAPLLVGEYPPREMERHVNAAAEASLGRARDRCRVPAQQRDHLVGRAHIGEHHHQDPERRVVFFVSVAGIRVRHEEHLVIEHHRVARGQFAADIGRSADDDQRIDAARAQYRVEVGGALDKRAEPGLAHGEVARGTSRVG